MSLKLAGALVSLALLASTAMAQTAGTYDSLSAGDRKHVDALYSAQQPPAGTPSLTPNEIAARKGDTGWGNVFKDLKAQGYYPDAKNFGGVVSAYHHEQNELRKEAHRAAKAERKVDRREAKLERHDRSEKVERPNKPERIK